jgi:DNA polymerase elongation subunit (family B)
MESLAVTRRLSRDPKSYQQTTLTALVAQELLGRGVELSPGEMLQYVITDSQSDVTATRARSLAWIDADWTYDTAAYQLMLLRAFDSLFSLLGYSLEWLQARQLKALPASSKLLPRVAARQASLF